MIIKVCDRCGKQFHPIPGFMQAKLPSYSITTVGEGFPLNWRQVDLCNECQDDFSKWMKEKLDEKYDIGLVIDCKGEDKNYE